MADIVFASAFGGRISAFLDDRVARGYKRETWIAPLSSSTAGFSKCILKKRS